MGFRAGDAASVHRAFVATLTAVALAGTGCPPPPKPPAPPPTPLVVKTYAPLAFAADARAPAQAVLLGTDDRGGSTLVPLPPTPGAPRVLDAAMAGGIARVALTATASTDGAVHVSLSGDAMPGWRAGAWHAAFVAAATLDKDLVDVAISIDAAPTVDDGASALIAAGLVAVRTGTHLDATATVIGSIEPDGTVGPVADLAARVHTAAASGMRTIGIPSGARKELGALPGTAKLVEVADVVDAYDLLTGAHLPRTVPLAENAMELEPAVVQALDVAYKTQQQLLAIQWAGILQLESAGRMPPLLTFARDHAKSLAQSAETLRKRGQLGAAVARIISATRYAACANATYEVLADVQANHVDAAIASIASHEPASELTGPVFAALGAQQPATLGTHLALVAAFGASLRASILETTGAPTLAAAKSSLKLLAGKSSAELGSDQTAELVVDAVLPALLYLADSAADAARARDSFVFAIANDAALVPATARIDPLATAYQIAATAILAHAESLRTAAKARPTTFDPALLVATRAVHLADADSAATRLATGWGSSSFSSTMLRFAGARLALAASTELAATEVFDRAHDAALAALLVSAERAARTHAHAAKVATGIVPLQARLAYQDAIASRASATESADAILGFWTASAYCDLAIQLARR